jgi:hypothetical protein
MKIRGLFSVRFSRSIFAGKPINYPEDSRKELKLYLSHVLLYTYTHLKKRGEWSEMDINKRSAQTNTNLEMRSDVAVIGGGLGGCAAALAAAKAGKTVVMTEETSWIGGQLTS